MLDICEKERNIEDWEVRTASGTNTPEINGILNTVF
jgi:hypothetical protein